MKLSKIFSIIGLTSLVFVANATPAKALDFTFSFSNEAGVGNVNGTVTGRIIGLANNAASSATAVYIDSYPSGLVPSNRASSYLTPINALTWSKITQNSFTVANNIITADNFISENNSSSGLDRLLINGASTHNYLSIGSANAQRVWNNNGLSGVIFASATAVPFEFSPSEGIALGIPLFIGLRILKKRISRLERKTKLCSEM